MPAGVSAVVTMMRFLSLFLCLSCWVATGCTKNIPNTGVEDTPQNRSVIEFLERYRNAVEKRQIGALLAMAHPKYLDDNGTPIGSDDLDFEGLQKKLGRWSDRVTDVRYEIKYRRIHYEGERILVEFRYSASFELKVDAVEEGEEPDDRWSRRVGDHRVILTRVPGEQKFLILSGM